MPLEDFDLPELADAPLDMPAALPGMPNPQAPPSEKKGGGLGQFASMLPILAAAAKKGGRAGIAGFLQGVQRAQAAKQQQARLAQQDARLGQQDARQGRIDQGNDNYRQQQLMLAAETRRQAEETRKQALLQQFGTALNGVDDPESVRALLELYGGQADAAGIGRPVLEKYAMQVATPTKLQTKAATSRIGKLRTEYGTKWMEEGAKFMHDVPGGERVSFQELLRRGGLTPDPTAPQAEATSRIKADVPLDRQLAMALEAGDTALAKTIRQTIREMDEDRRDPRRPNDDRSPTIRERELRLDEQVAYLLRNPDQATGQKWGQIVGAYKGLGVDYIARRDDIARRVTTEDRSAVDDVDALDLPTAKELIAGLDRSLAPAPPAGGAPGARGGGAGPAGAAGSTRRTATRAQVEAVAKQRGVAYADAKRELEARGVSVLP